MKLYLLFLYNELIFFQRSKILALSLCFFNILFSCIAAIGVFELFDNKQTSIALLPIVSLIVSSISSLIYAERIMVRELKFIPSDRVSLLRIPTLPQFLAKFTLLLTISTLSLLISALVLNFLLPLNTSQINFNFILVSLGFCFGFSSIIALFLKSNLENNQSFFLLPLILLPLSLPLIFCFYSLVHINDSLFSNRSFWGWLLIFINLLYFNLSAFLIRFYTALSK